MKNLGHLQYLSLKCTEKYKAKDSHLEPSPHLNGFLPSVVRKDMLKTLFCFQGVACDEHWEPAPVLEVRLEHIWSQADLRSVLVRDMMDGFSLVRCFTWNCLPLG